MAGVQDIPNLRLLSVALILRLSQKYPKYVFVSDADRIKSASNILLVGSRVIINILRRAEILTADDVAAVIAEAKPPTSKNDAVSSMMDNDQSDVVVVEGVLHPWTVMAAVDECLAVPALRNRAKSWFIIDFYPGVLRRALNGSSPTTREIEIMAYQVSIMRGEQ